MSAMLTLRCNNRRKKIFIWYDFKQIRDAVLLLFFSDKTNHFEKIFIYANPGKVGNRCTAVLYQRRDIWSRFAKNCNIFLEYREAPKDFEAIAIEKAVENYAKVLVGLED